MRQYTGFGNAADTNERFKYLIANGQTGLNVAFDLPTQCGLDSDDPLAEGEIGRVGMAVDTLRDFEIAFDGIDLDKITVSLTINGAAAILIAMYLAMAREARLRRQEAARHRAERHPEGVHRPRHLDLPGRAVDPAGRRHDRVLRRARAEVQPGLGLRLPHPRIRARTRRRRWPTPSASPRPTPTRSCGAASRSTSSPGACRSTSTSSATSSSRWPSSAPAAACGRKIMKEQYGATKPGSMWLRMIAGGGGGGLTFEQPELNIVRGAYYALIARALGRADHGAVLLRRGLHDPERVRAAHLAAHDAAADRGDGPRRHRRSARRLVLRRDADQPDARRDGTHHRATSTRRAASSSWSPRARSRPRSRRRPTACQRDIESGAFRKVGVNCYRNEERGAPTVEFHPYDEEDARAQIAALSRGARGARRGRGRAALERVAADAAADGAT